MILRRILILVAAAAIFLSGRPSPAHAYTQIYADIEFYDALSPYGDWVHTSRYGDCWAPYHTARSWRPYTVGHWVDTDYGWMWVSEDPWGGLPYHYGRWVFDPYYGWVWVPDDDLVWAPAWVSWRYSDDYVGWAPLPPEADWGGSGLTINISYVDRRIDRSGWCFAPVRTFGTTRVRYSILPPSRNVTLLAETRNVTRYVSYNSLPAERGLRPELIERATGRRIQPYRITDARSPNFKGANIQGRTIEVYRPRIKGARERTKQFVTERRGGAQGSMQRQEGLERRNEARARQEDIRQQRQTEQRRREEMQRGRSGQEGRGQGEGQYQREERGQPQGQGERPRGRERGRRQPQGQGQGQGQDQGSGQPQGQGQDQGRRQPQGQGQDQGRGRDKKKDHGKDQEQDQGQGDQDKEHGKGHGR